MADNTARIAQIEEVLRTGATEVQKDGTKVVYDFGQLRNELRKLRATDDVQGGRRPVVSRINLDC